MRSLCLAVVLMLAIATTTVAAEWFDEACVCCKPMHENPTLKAGMKWETHKLANGLMMVAAAPEGMQDEFEATCEKMHTLAMEASPSDLKCGFCESFGALMQAGAKTEEVSTGIGNVTLLTSDDPAVVKKIHAHSDRTQQEMDKMAAATR
ncbi:hypothetical protein Pla108_31390 [Botrimarina colliarenosi]|uniref:Uncharacterized protein n=1 Tax=Botrimarina colliarenosi TaxID=2528001 RepID=A0A5C6A9M6_9BACT|nr:hypothetical protein [Botrimarina colliarenosi]TWT96057.1 hypothetical protein Pla108_31390 [Botrimarina colliarenosi]